MSSVHRTITGDVLIRHLTQDERMLDPELLGRHGRTARTLVKEGPLRLTLIGLAAGGEIPAHRADGPVTIQVTEGDGLVRAIDREYPMHAGDVLVLAAGVEHSVRSQAGCVLLLTLVHPTGEGAPDGAGRTPAAPGNGVPPFTP